VVLGAPLFTVETKAAGSCFLKLCVWNTITGGVYEQQNLFFFVTKHARAVFCLKRSRNRNRVNKRCLNQS
jgi:hypothetical protein